MIGVAIPAKERPIVAEFFELFKTPWEFYRSGERYDVVLCTSDNICTEAAGLVLMLSGEPTSFETEQKVCVKSRPGGFVVSSEGDRLPDLWQPGNVSRSLESSFERGRDARAGCLCEPEQSDNDHPGRLQFVRGKCAFLLTVGQPAVNAGIPTLDNHIALVAWLD